MNGCSHCGNEIEVIANTTAFLDLCVDCLFSLSSVNIGDRVEGQAMRTEALRRYMIIASRVSPAWVSRLPL